MSIRVWNIADYFCRRDGLWKRRLEEFLEKNPREYVTLLAIGEVKVDVLKYLNSRNDLYIIKLETRYLKQRRKGLGLKVQVIKKLT